MIEGRCRTCKWWSGPVVEDEFNHGPARCTHVKLSYPGGAIADGAVDVGGYDGIETGPEFGCIHHEPKE